VTDSSQAKFGCYVNNAGVSFYSSGTFGAIYSYDYATGTLIDLRLEQYGGRVVIGDGTTVVGDMLYLSTYACTVQGTRDSHSLVWQGHYFPAAGADHTVDWRAYNDVTSDVNGASAWTLQSRIDAGTFATRMIVDSTGLLTLNPGTSPSTAILLDIAAPAGPGNEYRNTHALQWTGRYYADSNPGAHNWQAYGESISVGIANWLLRYDNTGGGYTTVLQVSNSGMVTLNAGASPVTALLLDIAAPAASGAEVLRNSHSIDLRSRMHTAADVQHYGDWTMQACPATGLAGVSMLKLATSVDGGAASTALQLGFVAGTLGAFWVGDPTSVNTSWSIKPADKSTGNLAGDEMRFKAGKAFGDGNGGDWYGDAGAHGDGGSGTHGTVKLGTSVASAVEIAQSAVLTTIAGTLALPNINTGSGTYPVKYGASGAITYDTSDARQKDRFEPYVASLAELRRLTKPQWYDYHPAHLAAGAVVWVDGPAKRRVGWTAQDVAAAVPGAAYIPADISRAFCGFERQDLVPALFNATLEIDDKVERLQRRVTELEAEVREMSAVA